MVISLIFRDYIQFRGKDIDYGCQRLVNELQSVLEEAVLRSTGSVLTPQHLPPHFPPAPPRQQRELQSQQGSDLLALVAKLFAAGEQDVYGSLVFDFEGQLLRDHTVEGNNQNIAALSRNPVRMEDPLDSPDEPECLSRAWARFYSDCLPVFVDQRQHLFAANASVP